MLLRPDGSPLNDSYKEYKLSDRQYEALKLASMAIKVPNHFLGSVPQDPTVRINKVWQLIGKELKFKWWTAVPKKGSKLIIYAQPL